MPLYEKAGQVCAQLNIRGLFSVVGSARTLYRGGNRLKWVLLGGLILEYDTGQLLGCATPISVHDLVQNMSKASSHVFGKGRKIKLFLDYSCWHAISISRLVQISRL